MSKPKAAAETRAEQAEALGFSSVEQMESHEQWLRENGTAQFKRWLASVEAPAQPETSTAQQPQDREDKTHKMLNGLCVPVSTPDDYFKLSAAQWLRSYGELIKAGQSLQRFNVELEQARAELET